MIANHNNKILEAVYTAGHGLASEKLLRLQ
jgi:phage tail protein X